MAKSRPMMPAGGNDNVYTPPWLARAIVDYFEPKGTMMEPCRGQGAFYNLMPKGSAWCELDEGRDFLQYTGPKVDWIITNPPWSKLRDFLIKSMDTADNVVFLCLINAVFMKARMRDIREAGFSIDTILELPTPPKPWTQTGFCLGAIYIRQGTSSLTRLKYLDVKPPADGK